MDAMMQQVWIYLDEGDHVAGTSVVSRVLQHLRAAGCAGATVLRGVGGFGVHGVIHSDLIADLPTHMPLVITFVDRAERIQAIIPQLDSLIPEGMLTITPVQFVRHYHRGSSLFPRHLTVAHIMSHDVARVLPNTPVAEIVGLLIERAVRALPVVAPDDRVVGIITDGDLLKRGATILSIRLQHELPADERIHHTATLTTQPQRAAELMTPDPVTLPSTLLLGQAAALMAQHNLKRMPVVDAEGRLVGMISRSDLLNTLADGIRQDPHTPLHIPAGSPTTVGELMYTSVPTVQRDTPLTTTLDQLLASEKRRVVVIDADGAVVGIITDGDVLRRAARQLHASALSRIGAWLTGGERPTELEVEAKGRTAADIMSSPVITVTPDTPIADAVRLMMTHAIKRLPVVDGHGQVLGIVGRAAVLAALSLPTHPA